MLTNRTAANQNAGDEVPHYLASLRNGRGVILRRRVNLTFDETSEKNSKLPGNLLETDNEAGTLRSIATMTAGKVASRRFYRLYGRKLARCIKLIVIRDQTSASDFAGEDVSNTLSSVARQIPGGVAQETLADFQANNKQSHRLSNSFNLKADYVLVSREELAPLFRNGSDWTAFYAKYPGSQGAMTLSRVGFNPEKNQALVYVGNQRGGKSGAGHYFLLAKKGADWIVQHQVEVWLS